MNPVNRLRRLVVVLVLMIPTALLADQTDPRLDELFTTLKTSQDAQELRETEAAIWDIWYDSGDDSVDTLMAEAADLVRTGDLAAAERRYSEVIDTLPDFSEGWNRRATIRYYQGDHEGSLADIERTLRLEPRHFGAIWGLGMILGAQGDFERAIVAFERLLEIKPNAPDARPRIELLKQELAKQSI